jgi:hypothetical protein
MNDLSRQDESFLETFRDLGCYVDDLCLEPVNHLPEPERAARRVEAEPALARRIKQYQPVVVVAIGKTTAAPCVQRALDSAGLADARFERLPFPGRPEHKGRLSSSSARSSRTNCSRLARVIAGPRQPRVAIAEPKPRPSDHGVVRIM